MTSADRKTWPRIYLLSIYEKAISEGAMWVNNLTEPNYKSLKASFYRLRRRSDTTNVTIIRPEFHLVTFGEYDATNQRCAVMYDSLPDGEDLPSLGSMLDADRSQAFTPPTLNTPAPLLVLPHEASLAPEMTESDIDAYVRKLTQGAVGHD